MPVDSPATPPAPAPRKHGRKIDLAFGFLVTLVLLMVLVPMLQAGGAIT